MDNLYNFFVETVTALFMPLVCFYHIFTANPFINVAVENAQGMERLGNTLLSPVHYLFVGKKALLLDDGSWQIDLRFSYEDGSFWIKTALSALSLPISLPLGCSIKAMGFLSEKTKEHHRSLTLLQESQKVEPQKELYEKIGIHWEEPLDFFSSLHLDRREKDRDILIEEKKALQEIAEIFSKEKIAWWVDCGTCLGVYRYGGAIPWDWDIDLAVLIDDFENVRRALNQLDPELYMVQDWSTRAFPNSFLKIFLRKTKTMIDVFCFRVDLEKKELRYVLASEKNIFTPDWWKIKESAFQRPVPFEVLFPLKKAHFDGVEVLIPQDPEQYLKRCYGDNLAPARIYNSNTDAYEKDLSHPYWKTACN